MLVISGGPHCNTLNKLKTKKLNSNYIAFKVAMSFEKSMYIAGPIDNIVNPFNQPCTCLATSLVRIVYKDKEKKCANNSSSR